MRLLRLTVVAAVGMMTLSSCFWDSGDEPGRPVAKSSSAGPCKNANPPPPTSPDLNPAECRWWTNAEEIVGFDDVVIVTEEAGSGHFTMSALRAQTGEPAWTTPRLEGRDRKLKIVHWQGKPYASVRYQTGTGPAATFVSLAYDGDRTPVTWTSPDDRTRLHEQAVSSDDVVVIEHDSDKQSDVCEKIIDYAVIDPTNGRARPLLVPSCLSVDAFGDGWYARPFGSAPFPVAFNDYDEKLLWQVDQFTPEGATPDQPHDVAAGYGDYVVTRWTKDSGNPLDPSTDWVLAVHDRTGKIIATSPFGSRRLEKPDERDTVYGITTLASPNGKRLIFRGGRASVAVDLAAGTAVPLDPGLRPLSITDEGVIYAVNQQGAAVSVTGTTTWTGTTTSLVPATVVDGVAVVSSVPPAGKRVTATAWAFGLRAEAIAKRYAPMVWLHPDEPDFPTSTTAVALNSELWFNHNGICHDIEPVAKSIDEAILGRVGYVHSEGYPHEYGECGHPEGGKTYRSNEPIEGGLGFYIDVGDNILHGNKPDSAKHVHAPVYWEYVTDSGGRNAAYLYWFFYANDTYTGSHESDWERVAVQLTDGRPTGMVLWKHEATPCLVSWKSIDTTTDNEPVIFAAKGAHGSYPKEDSYTRYDGTQLGTDETRKGFEWHTAENPLPVRAQPWYGYRGNWGKPGATSFTSGKPGPNDDRDLQSALTTTPCDLERGFAGAWQSAESIDNPGHAKPYTLHVKLPDPRYTTKVTTTATYPGLGCNGEWVMTDSQPTKVVFREAMRPGPDPLCGSTGTVELTKTASGLHYTRTAGNSTQAATADLVSE
jgi:hypothetical protein